MVYFACCVYNNKAQVRMLGRVEPQSLVSEESDWMQQGGVAQMVERVLSMHEARGSIPRTSILICWPTPHLQICFLLHLTY